MYELTILTDFSGAHCLPDYPGKCSQLHGHNWQVEVTVAGNELNKLGMLMDFGELKRAVNLVISTLDHHYLNEIAAFQTLSPTSEHIARYIYQQLKVGSGFPSTVQVRQVKVWESLYSAASYREE